MSRLGNKLHISCLTTVIDVSLMKIMISLGLFIYKEFEDLVLFFETQA